MQIIVGALTTGVAAAGRAHVWPLSVPLREGFLLGLLVKIGAAVAVLGGISTILASYLAKVRGSGEPELSSIRTRELSSFLREVHAFIIDDGSFLFSQHFQRGVYFLITF
jgi:hypothetical protein